jgi:glycosyltransferase involved in cell wall biosynthesis
MGNFRNARKLKDAGDPPVRLRLTARAISTRVRVITERMASNPPERQDAGTEGRGITFIVPCFNEDPAVVLSTVSRLREAAAGASWEHEVIVVDDCSSRTGYDEAGLGGARLVRHRVNRGYGAALSTGLRNARFPWIGIVDADGTYPVEDFTGMLGLTRDYQMIIGARRWGDIHWLRRIPKRCLTWLASFLANHAIPDLNSGMRIFHREVYDGHRRIFPERFSFSSTLTMVALTSGFEVSFVGIDYFERVGRSTIHPVKDPVRFGYQLLRLSLYFRPLRFFLPLSFVVAAFAVARGTRDMMLNDHFGGLTLVLFFMAFQVFFFGLIAEIINKK